MNKKFPFLESLGHADETFVKEVFEYSQPKRSGIVMTKHKLTAVAVAAILAVSLAVSSGSIEIMRTPEGKLLEVEYVFSKPLTIDPRFRQITSDERMHTNLPLDEAENIVIFNGVYVHLGEEGEVMHFKKGETVKLRFEADLEAEGACKEGMQFGFGKYYSKTDIAQDLFLCRYDDDVNGVVEYSYTFPVDTDCELYVRCYSPCIHVKSITLDRIKP